MIYFHIPFCRQKCSYCNFHFSVSVRDREPMLAALKKELKLRQGELQSRQLNSVYFGGGTPSLLGAAELHQLIEETADYFSFSDDIEITVEANPDDLTDDFLKRLSASPANRLSIGTQSFYDADLKLMNRAHNGAEAVDSIRRAQDFGFPNISIDLIYGTPTAKSDTWQRNLDQAVGLGVPHISAYALTVEPQTALNAWISQGKVKAPAEQQQHDDFFYMSSFLASQGFEHYEISNFGKPGFHSRHNGAYWQYKEYLGIGPSAHSYDGCQKRSWNISHNRKYIDALQQHQLPLETEELSARDRYNEMLMIGLRTRRGVDFAKLQQLMSDDRSGMVLSQYLSEGKLELKDGYLAIPEEHWFLADGIASDLFVV